MTTPTWPTALNYLAERGSLQFRQAPQQLRSEFDYGPARMRRRFTRQIATATFTLVLTSSEHEVFKTFFVGDLQSGVNWFTMPVFTGDEYQTHAIRFTEPPVVSDGGYRHVKISAKVELKQLTIWDSGAAWLVGEYGESFVTSQLIDPLQTIVNVDWPTVTEDY